MTENPILSAEFKDNMSGPAAQAGAELGRLAAQVETVDAKVKKTEASARSYVNRLDEVTKFTRALGAEQRRLTDMQVAFDAELAKGRGDIEAFGRATEAQRGRIEALNQKLADAKIRAAERAAASQGLVSAIEAEAAAMASAATALDNLRAKYDPAFKAQQALARQMEELATLEKAGGDYAKVAAAAFAELAGAEERAAAATAASTAAMEKQAAILADMPARVAAVASANAQAVASIRAAQAARAADDPRNILGLSGAPKSAADSAGVLAAVPISVDPARAAAVAAANNQVISALRAAQAARAADDPRNILGLAAATKSAADSAAAFEDAFARAEKVTSRHADSTIRTTATTGEMTFAMRQLGVQAMQTISGIATGQPVLTTLVQQGHQVVDVALATGTGFSALAAGVKNMLSYVFSAPGALIAMTAALGYIAYAAESSNRALESMSARLRATRDDFAAVSKEAVLAAKAVAGQGQVGVPDALNAARMIQATPQFSGTKEELQDLVRLAIDVSAAFDEDLTAAAGRVTAALKSPKDAAQSFADQGLRGMNEAMVTSIARMQDSGRFAEAQRATLGALQDSVRDAAKAHTPLQKALEDLRGAFNATGADGKSFGQALGEFITDTVAGLVTAVAVLVRALKEARDFLTTAPSANPSGEAPSFWPRLPGAYLAATIGRLFTGAGTAPALPASTAEIMPLIQAGATAGRVDPVLLARLQASEGVLQADGTWKDSPTGRIGPMQIATSTFEGMRRQPGLFTGIENINNIRDPAQNVTAGAILFGHLLRKYGDPALAVLAYHDGEPVMDKVLAGAPGAGNSPEALRQAATVTAGYQGVGISGPVAGPPAPTGARGASVYGDQQGTIDRAMRLAREVGSADVSLTGADKLNDQIKQLTDARNIIEDIAKERGVAKESLPEWAALTGAIQTATGARHDAGDAIQQLTRRLQESLPPLDAADGAARTLAEAQNELTNAAKAAGREPTQEERYIVESAALKKLSTELRDQVAQIDRSAAANRTLADAYSVSAEAGGRATAEMQSQEAARKVAKEGTVGYVTALRILTDARVRDAQAAVDADTAIRNLSTKDEIAYLQREAELIGRTAREREKELAILKERQRLVGAKADLNSPQSQEALRLAGERANAAYDFKKQEDVFNELANIGTQAFDRIGAAITEAFATGKQSALDFGKIGKAVLSEMMQYVLKISVLNPILNSLFNTDRTTLSDVMGAANRIGGGGGFSLSNLGGLFGGGGSLSLFGRSTNDALGAMGGAYGPAPLSAVRGLLGSEGSFNPLAGSLMQGGLLSEGGFSLGGMFAGFGLGTTFGSLIARSQAQRTNSMIGAGIGSLLLGPLGGIAGGLLGGLIGPKDSVRGYGFRLQSAGYGPDANPTNGMADSLLPISRQFYNASGAAAFDQADQLVSKVNAFLAANSLQVGGVSIVGGNKDGADYSWADAGSLSEAFTRLRFSSKDDSRLTAALSGQVFDDPAKLETFVNGFKEAAALVDQLGNAPMAALDQAIKNINDTFDDAVEKARKYGLAEEGLATQRARQIAELQAAAVKERTTLMAGLQARNLASTGQSQAAALLRFDTDAQRQLDDLITTFRQWFGDSYAQHEEYQAARTLLSQVLAQERNQAVNAATDGGRTQVAGVIDSLRNFGLSIQTGSASALSPQQQYALSSQQFDNVARAALGGDFKALQDSQSYAAAFLNTSRNVNGSGEQYAADYNRVMSFLQAVAGASADALTASAMAQIQQSATDRLEDALAALGNTVAGATTDAVTSTATTFGEYASAARIEAANAAAQAANDNAAMYASMYATGVAQLVSAVQSAAPTGGVTRDQLYEVTAGQTDRVVAAVGAVRTEIYNLRQEVQHRAAAPAGYGGGGSWSGAESGTQADPGFGGGGGGGMMG